MGGGASLANIPTELFFEAQQSGRSSSHQHLMQPHQIVLSKEALQSVRRKSVSDSARKKSITSTRRLSKLLGLGSATNQRIVHEIPPKVSHLLEKVGVTLTGAEGKVRF